MAMCTSDGLGEAGDASAEREDEVVDVAVVRRAGLVKMLSRLLAGEGLEVFAQPGYCALEEILAAPVLAVEEGELGVCEDEAVR